MFDLFGFVDVQNPEDDFLGPEDMLEKAYQVVGIPPLRDYEETISLLRSRGWTFRRIAEFLTENGVPVSHNQVYYLVRKNAEEDDVNRIDCEMAVEEKEEHP